MHALVPATRILNSRHGVMQTATRPESIKTRRRKRMQRSKMTVRDSAFHRRESINQKGTEQVPSRKAER